MTITKIIAVCSLFTVIACDSSGLAEVPLEDVTTLVQGEHPTQREGTLPQEQWLSIAPETGVLLSVASQGQEPRKHLRYQPVVNASENGQMEMKMSMGMDMGMPGAPAQNIDVPTLTLSYSSTINSVEPGGTINSSTNFTGVSVAESDGPMAGKKQEIEASMKGLIGINTIVNSTALGYTIDTNTELQESTPPQIKAQLEAMSATTKDAGQILPFVPVGVGAKWERLHRVSAQGMNLIQHSEITLEKIEGDDVELSVKLIQILPESGLSLPGMPAGADFTVDQFDSVGSGVVNINLKKLNPISSNVKVTLNMAVTSEIAPDMKTTMKMSNNTEIVVTSVDAAKK